jgi:UDP-N-acetylmuramoyl-L-alanyl-D-glutamate--2,6-diaminopimelate ligase
MKLSAVLAEARLLRPLSQQVAGLEITGLEYDSRRVERGQVFFALQGARAEGRQFAQQAWERGAVAVVSDQPPLEGFAGTWIQVERGRQALAAAARAFYHHPDRRVRFTGITGTNGKTTTSFLTEAMLRAAGHVTGLIGTIEYRLAGEVRPAGNTTPESLDIARFADELARRGGEHLVSEVSSHALAQGRVSGFEFHTAVFTNLTRDHLDFHHTMEAYAAAKRLLFVPEDGPAPKWAVMNADDPAAATLAPGSGTNTIWYGMSAAAGLRAEKIHTGFQSLRLDLVWQGERQPVASPLIGVFNVSNILAAAGVGISYGLALPQIAAGIAACHGVPGRFERVDAGQPFLVVVDYAHTDDALRNLIRAARELTSARVITLFGCGGDRDRTKRPLMGMAAAELSDFVVLTSDNPRSEDPLGIMNDAMVGLRRFDTAHVAEPDRAKAIRVAIEQARPGDAVLLAGKGHETYQILKDKTIHFDDRETARAVLESLGYGGSGKSPAGNKEERQS